MKSHQKKPTFKRNVENEGRHFKRYFELKSKFPNMLLLLRVSRLYTALGPDAITVSKILGTPLTKKKIAVNEEKDFSGFPAASLDIFLTKLVKAGHQVAVCDQLEVPPPKKQDKAR